MIVKKNSSLTTSRLPSGSLSSCSRLTMRNPTRAPRHDKACVSPVPQTLPRIMACGHGNCCYVMYVNKWDLNSGCYKTEVILSCPPPSALPLLFGMLTHWVLPSQGCAYPPDKSALAMSGPRVFSAPKRSGIA